MSFGGTQNGPEIDFAEKTPIIVITGFNVYMGFRCKYIQSKETKKISKY